ncbi:helix-turn-helix domain-containing protein [Pseudomonas protegens]|uniref:helix-turn-helix transcriptional regulator n=1 Tax=Pseudomonas protegens TaxID=380021 RepID=UPI0039057E7C
MLPFSMTRPAPSAGPGHELVEFDRQQINLFAAQVQRCEAHWHAAAELICVLKGRFLISVDPHSQHLGPGGMLYINPERSHELQALEADSQLLTVQFSPHLFEPLQPGLHIDYQVPDASQYRPRDRQIKAALRQLVAHDLDGAEGDVLRRTALIYLLLSSLHQANAAPRQPAWLNLRSKDQQLIRHCIDYINRHYQRELPLAEVAAQANLSYHHFSKLFKKVNGCNFKDYLAQVRVNRARFLLKNTQLPITEICYSCGFSEHKQLIVAFRNHCALTPSEYRKQYLSQLQRDYRDAGRDFRCLEWDRQILGLLDADPPRAS